MINILGGYLQCPNLWLYVRVSPAITEAHTAYEALGRWPPFGCLWSGFLVVVTSESTRFAALRRFGTLIYRLRSGH